MGTWAYRPPGFKHIMILCVWTALSAFPTMTQPDAIECVCVTFTK